MAFIKVDGLGDTQEAKAAPEGEYDLRVIKVSEKEGTDKEGNEKTSLLVSLIIEDQDVDAPPFTHFLTYPYPGGAYNDMNMREIARFIKAFDIPSEDDGFDPDDFVGATGKCMVGQRTIEGGDYDGQVVNTLRLPRLD